MASQTAIVPQFAPPTDVPIVDGRLAPNSIEGQWRVATALYKSGLLPNGIKSPEAAFVLVAAAMELKVGFLDALTGIGVINGKPCLHSRLPMMLAMRTGQFAGMAVEWKGSGDSLACTVVVKRMVKLPDATFQTLEFPGSFAVADAKAAGLLGKDVWKSYAKDMLLARARSRALNQAFPDAMGGMSVVQPDDEDHVFTPTRRAHATVDESQPQLPDSIDAIPDPTAAEMPPPVDAPEPIPAADAPTEPPKAAVKPKRPKPVYDPVTGEQTGASETEQMEWDEKFAPETVLTKR